MRYSSIEEDLSLQVQKRPTGKPAKRTPAPRRARSETIALLVVCALIVGAGFLLQYQFYPKGLLADGVKDKKSATLELAPVTSVRINEVMTSNKGALRDSYGGNPDWIELYNEGDQPVDITGWILSSKVSGGKRFVFPAEVLEPHAFTVVFASGRNQSEPGGEYHAPFQLSKSGGSLVLLNNHEQVVESISVPALGRNQSYSRVGTGSDWIVTGEYTPGMANTAENHLRWINPPAIQDSPIYINELMASNKSFIHSADDTRYDWIELYNAGSAPIPLKDYALTNNPDKPGKWRFPDITIQPGEYLIVFASGRDTESSGKLHTNFSLRSERGQLQLFDAMGRLLSEVSWDNLRPDQSLARREDGSYAVTNAPSPGAANP